MGKNGFFVDPFGDVLPCNGMDEKMSMGNLNEQTWEQIWNSPRADTVRSAVGACTKNCWMIGSAAPAMKDNIAKPLTWILANKLKGKYCFSQPGKL